ncbi:MAG: TlpA family protein disulfide reductase [Dysgonomonas sp.]
MKKALILFAILTYTLTSIAQDESGTILKQGDTMPAFTLSSTISGNVDSKDLKGKVVLINIFATWCPPCQLELAEVKKALWPKYKDNPNFVMLTVGREHTDAELTKYNEKKKFAFPLYPDSKREFTAKFATKSIPRSYLIDKDGKIIYMSIGYNENDFRNLLELIDKNLND